MHPENSSLPQSRSFRRSFLATAAPSLALCHSFAWLCIELVTTTSRSTGRDASATDVGDPPKLARWKLYSFFVVPWTCHTLRLWLLVRKRSGSHEHTGGSTNGGE